MPIINQEILANDVYIYPSANAIDGGEINTEENLSALSDKFVFRSFVVKRKDEQAPGLHLTSSGTNLLISAGECFIEGKYINLGKNYTIDLTAAKDEYGKTIFDSIGTTFYVLLTLKKDVSGCVMGDQTPVTVNITGVVSGSVMDICQGIVFQLTPNLAELNNPLSLYLGTVKALTASTVEVANNPSKYCIIDISQVGSDGQSIEDWLRNLIVQAFANLGTLVLNRRNDETNSPILILNYNNTQSWIRNTYTGTEVYFKDVNGRESKVTVTPTGLVYDGPDTTNFDIIAAIKAIQQAAGGVSLIPASASSPSGVQTQTADGGKTESGDSTFAARADHYHYGYIRNSSSLSNNNVTQSIGTNLSVTGEVRASRVYNAVWNDYADALPKAPNTQTEPGDIIAKDEYSEGYVLGTSYAPRLVVGVHSDSWGHLLGGIEGKLDDYIPVAVCGNVRVKVVGKVKIGDFIVASFVPGVGAASSGYVPGTIVGKALENKETDEVSRILMQVMLI